MKNFVIRVVGGGVIVAVLTAGTFVYKMFVGAEQGEPCSDSSECKGFDGECLEDDTGTYCTVTCSTDGDCDNGWVCETTTVVNEFGQETGETNQLCARPLPGQIPAGQLQPMPGAPPGAPPPPAEAPK